MNLAPADLKQIEDLFYAALDLDDEERARLLAPYSEGIRQDVVSLIEEDRRGSIVSRAIYQTANAVLDSKNENLSIAPGQRIGSYEIQREIGSGGMGSVYLATRADDTYQRQVAIKFVRSEYNTTLFRERFQRERRILGRLDHPYIARLLDAGSTPQDQPYFVMEYVTEGRPITEYVRQHHLSLRERIELFVKVCEAVQYAHQNLTVHRDLKPGNILVDSFGHPKLLDFGIAKIVTPEGNPTDQTVAAGLRMLTPDYASPEHVAGETVTTATDVYSLGAVLCEALLEARPPRLSDGQDEIDVPRSLGADLCGILRMAMHRDPARRYATANELRADLLNYLESLPIRARSYSWPERAQHFVRRYRTFLAASLVIGAGLTLSALSSLQSANRAEAARMEAVRERNRAEAALRQMEVSRQQAVDSARDATVQKLRAEADRNLARIRSTENLELSSQLLRELQDKILGRPGTGPARQELLSIAATHLEKLAQGPDAGPKVWTDLALAYIQLGDTRGVPTVSNAGDVPGALDYLQKAERILTAPERRDVPDAIALLVRLRARQVELFSLIGDRAKSESTVIAGLALGRKLARYDKPLKGEVAAFMPLVQMLNAAGQAAQGYQLYDRALQYAEECRDLASSAPQTAFVKDQTASCWSIAARALHGLIRMPEAVTAIRRAIELREEVLQELPANNTARRALMLGYSHLTSFLGGTMGVNMGDSAGAVKAMEKVREHARRIYQSDPADKLAQRDLAMSTSRHADLVFSLKQYPQAIEHLTEAAKLLEGAIQSLPADSLMRGELVYVYKRLGDSYELAGGREAASKSLEACYRGLTAARELEQSKATNPGAYLSLIELRLKLAETVQNPVEAESHADRMVELLQAGLKAFPKSPSLLLYEITMQAGVGDVYEKLRKSAKADQVRTAALAAWKVAPAARQAKWPATERELVTAKLLAPR
jgi:serine/threonine protein kinase